MARIMRLQRNRKTLLMRWVGKPLLHKRNPRSPHLSVISFLRQKTMGMMTLESEGNGPDPNREDSAEVPSKDKQALSHPMQRSDTNNWRRRLNARDRRKLLALKGKKMTLRQVGIQFAHLDTDFLRQVWGELNLPERCTRSR